jgi:hypothetical protein
MSKTPLELLVDLCTEWGGSLIQVSKEEYNECSTTNDKGYYHCPFASGLGVEWNKKIIMYTGEVNPSAVIHEMGHVFASHQTPRHSDEYAFFGWEYAVSKYVRIPFKEWAESNNDYAVGSRCEEFGSLKPKEQKEIIEERLQVARASGLLKDTSEIKDMPQAVR